MTFPVPTIDELTNNPERYKQLLEHIEELHEEDQKRNEQFLKLWEENNKLHSQIEDKDKIIEEKDRINEEKGKIIQEQAEQIKEITKDRLRQEKTISKFYEADQIHREQIQTIHSQKQEMFRLVNELKGNLVPSANKILKEMVHNDHQQGLSPHQPPPPQHQYSPINNASHNDAAHLGSPFNFSTPIQHDNPFGLEQSSSKHKHDSGISFGLNPEEHIDEKTEQIEQRMEQFEKKMKQIEEKQKEEKTEIEEKIGKIEEKVEKIDEEVEKIEEKVEQKMEQIAKKMEQQIGEKMGQKEVTKLEKIEEEFEENVENEEEEEQNEKNAEQNEEKKEVIEEKPEEIEEKPEEIEEKPEEIEEKPEEIEENKVHQNEDGNVQMNSMSKAFRWSKLLLMGLLKLFLFVQFFLNFLENTGLYKVIPAEEGGGDFQFQLALFMPFVSIEEGPPELV